MIDRHTLGKAHKASLEATKPSHNFTFGYYTWSCGKVDIGQR